MSKRIGIVGGGQLGRMLALSAKSLGFVVNVLDPTPKNPAGQVADHQIVGDFKDEQCIKDLASLSDFLTFELELANSKILKDLSKSLPVNPSAETLDIIKDKFGQKKFLRENNIPTADFLEVNSLENAESAGQNFSYPFLLKSRFDAYDGRGNFVVKNEQDIKTGFESLGGKNLYAEKFIDFEKEIAVVAARSLNGEVATYPVVQTIHQDNICHLVLAPAPISDESRGKAKALAERVLEKLDGAGVFGIEMFLTRDGQVLINEIAPRVHNSGHFTMEACQTSQFEQHVRAVTGLPLGSTEMLAPAAVMINILGQRQGPAKPEGVKEALKLPNVSVHIYGKIETRPQRKMGHITVLAKTLEDAKTRAEQARKFITI